MKALNFNHPGRKRQWPSVKNFKNKNYGDFPFGTVRATWKGKCNYSHQAYKPGTRVVKVKIGWIMAKYYKNYLAREAG